MRHPSPKETRRALVCLNALRKRELRLGYNIETGVALR